MKFLALMLVVGGAASDKSVGTAEAEGILLAAHSFDDVAVGYDAITPATVHAYRALLRAPDGLDRFGKVLERGTPAGQLYALCGLFFLDPNAFDRNLARLQESRASVQRTDGCVVSRTTMREVLTRNERAPLMSHAGTIAAWRESRAEWLDIAGGSTCYRLRYLRSAEDSPALAK